MYYIAGRRPAYRLEAIIPSPKHRRSIRSDSELNRALRPEASLPVPAESEYVPRGQGSIATGSLAEGVSAKR